jgi:hypothetical protein
METSTEARLERIESILEILARRMHKSDEYIIALCRSMPNNAVAKDILLELTGKL